MSVASDDFNKLFAEAGNVGGQNTVTNTGGAGGRDGSGHGVIGSGVPGAAIGGTTPVVGEVHSDRFVPKGRPGVFNMDKFGYENPAGKVSFASLVIDVEDTMPVREARGVLARIHTAFGIDREPIPVRSGFDNALLLYAAVNQTSVLNPGEGKFGYGDVLFDYKRVLEVIGPNPRRFFRVFADETRALLRGILNTYDPNNIDQATYVANVRRVADDRGLGRYPDLCFDYAAYCTDLAAGEKAALKSSSVKVIGGTPNAVDVVNVARPQGRPGEWASSVG